MANKFQVKRTTVSGRTPNTTNSGNTHFIDTGELALNLTDGKMFSSNGTVYFEVGANLENISISSNATFGSSGKIVANGSFGTAGQVLTSNGTTMYWSTVSGGGGSGTVTQVNTGIGLSGGPITTTGTISVVANDGIVANSTGLFANAGTGVVVNATGIHVNSSYIGTLAANSATYLGGNTALDLRNYSDTQSGTAYTNATAFAANATNISSGTLDAARLPASVVQNTDSRTLSGNLVISGTSFTPSSNTVQLGNSTQRWVLSANTGDFTGTVTGTVANMSTSVNSALLTVGTSFIANTIGVFHTGTVNAASHTTSGFVANTTVIAPTSNTILLGNSIGRFVISANTIDTSGLITGGAGATITGQVNASTGFGSGTINATSNGLFANATTISLGNSSVNVAITTAGITSSGGTGVNPSSNTVGTALGTTTQRWVVTANSISTSGSGSIGTTLAAGNTTVTGFVNASASVNSALLTVGTAFIANTTGAYHTGLVNAAAFNTSGFVANTTAIVPTSNTILLGNSIGRFVISANTINTSGLITGSAGANITGTANLVDVNISGNLTVSGTTTYVNTTNLNVGDNIVTLNADLTNVTAPTENAGLEVNRGSSANVSFLWNETSDSWTLGNTDITGYANATVSVNSALLTVGTSFIANTIGAYHTGTMNAASFTTTNFTANTTGAYPLSNSAGTALGSSTQRWVLSANTGDFTGTVTGTVANMSTSVNSALLTVGTSVIANTSGLVVGNTTSGYISLGDTTPSSTRALQIEKQWTVDSSIITTFSNTLISNTVLTAARSYSGHHNMMINDSQNINSTGVAVGSDMSGIQTYIFNGTTAGTSNAALDDVFGVYTDIRNYASGSSANTITDALSQYSLIRTFSSGVITNAYGSRSLIGAANNSVTGNVTTAFAFHANINSNSAMTIGTGYLFFGAHTGTTTTTKYGVYVTNEANNYFSANVAIGGTATVSAINVGTSSFIANSTAVVIADPLTANGSTGTSGQVLTSNGSTGAPYWADAAGASSGVGRTVTSYTGNGSNTVYGVSYTAGYLDVYLNGVRLILGTDFVATNGTDITFTVAPANGDNIDLLAYSQTLIAPVNARTVTNYTADGSTSTYSVTYDVGYLDVYVNGIRLSSGVDYTATNGTSVVFSTNPLSGDYIELVSLTVAPLATNGTIRTVTYYTGDGSTTDYGINYNNGYLDVYVNGIKYKYGDDYTASNGSGISILSAPLAGDNIELVSYRNSANLSSYVSISGDTMTGALIVPVITSSGNVSGVNGYFTNINAASHTIGSTFIANTTGVYHTGTVNAASHTIGSSLIANTTGVYHTGTVNAASLTLGSSLIANTSGIYHTGVINAASLSIGSGSFSAHSTGVVITKPLTANGSTGTAGQVLASNGMSGSPYWTNPGTSVPNANTQVSSLGVGTPASGNTGEIRATDAITAYYSDRRLKENIKPIENAVEKVKQISGVTFTSNKVAEQYGYKNKNTQVGVIAQELELVLPQVVTAAPFDIGKREDGTEYSLSGENYKTVYYEKIVPLLIEAIKEQQVKIEQLESSLDQLSKRV